MKGENFFDVLHNKNVYLIFSVYKVIIFQDHHYKIRFASRWTNLRLLKWNVELTLYLETTDTRKTDNTQPSSTGDVL